MGKLLLFAAYAVYAAFWIRFGTHTITWMRAARQPGGPHERVYAKACGRTVLDVILFGRLFMVNPALWFAEWVFHLLFLLVLFRHLRFFLDPVPACVWWVQTPGLIAGYLLPFSIAYILVIRLWTKWVKYASPVNMFILGIVFVISALGVVMHAWFKPDLVGVKLFILGLMSLKPESAPGSFLFLLHFCLVLGLIPLLPTHIFTAPFVMMAARRREQALRMVLHDH